MEPPTPRRAAPLLPILLLLPVLALALWPGLDRFALERVDAALGRALAAFAVARGIDGALSVAQSAAVAVEPAGVGVSLVPGAVLDPVDDLVERFSSLMLVASASLGLQRLLLVGSAWWPLKLLLPVAALAWLLARGRGGARLRDLSGRLLLLLLALRLAVPVAALGSEAVYQALIAGEFARSEAALVEARDTLVAGSRSLQPEAPADQGLLERTGALLARAGEAFDPRARLAALETAASEATRHLVNLVAVFVVQTVLLPLGFLALFVRGARLLLAARVSPGAAPH